MYLGIIGKRFKDAGLRDVLVQSEIVDEGSIERALTGKNVQQSSSLLQVDVCCTDETSH